MKEDYTGYHIRRNPPDMTTYLLPSAIYGRANGHCRSKRRQLLDRFWDAVHFDSPDSPSNDNVFFFGKIDGYDEPSTPEIFAKFGSNPTIDVRAPWNSPTTPSFPCQPSAFLPVPPTILVQSPLSPGPPIEHPPVPVKKGFLSRNPSKPSSRWPKLAIPKDLKPRAPGITSPATAILALASSFLDDIVKSTRAQSLNTKVIRSPEGDIEIIDSEVYINVIDGSKGAGNHSTLDLQENCSLERLDIPPITALPMTATEVHELNKDMQSTSTTNSRADSAQELDALARMNRERQLSNLTCSV